MLERRFASRLDLSQFGRLTLRQVVALAGEDYSDASRRYWQRKCSACLVSGRGRGARQYYEPWGLARVLEQNGLVPRWGALVIQQQLPTLTRARKLGAEERESLGKLLGKWLREYSVPRDFPGVRDDADREDIKAQVALFVAQHASCGEGKLTRDEFYEAVKLAEAQALAWWKKEILRSRNRENRAPAKGSDGADFTGRPDTLEDRGTARSP